LVTDKREWELFLSSNDSDDDDDDEDEEWRVKKKTIYETYRYICSTQSCSFSYLCIVQCFYNAHNRSIQQRIEKCCACIIPDSNRNCLQNSKLWYRICSCYRVRVWSLCRIRQLRWKQQFLSVNIQRGSISHKHIGKCY
jgi:hypothetical protein